MQKYVNVLGRYLELYDAGNLSPAPAPAPPPTPTPASVVQGINNTFAAVIQSAAKHPVELHCLNEARRQIDAYLAKNPPAATTVSAAMAEAFSGLLSAHRMPHPRIVAAQRIVEAYLAAHPTGDVHPWVLPPHPVAEEGESHDRGGDGAQAPEAGPGLQSDEPEEVDGFCDETSDEYSDDDADREAD